MPLVIPCCSFRLRAGACGGRDPHLPCRGRGRIPFGDSGCPARAADKRTLRPGPLVNHPAPEERRRGLLLSSGLLSTSAACVPRRFCTFDQFCLVQRRMEQVPSRLSYVDLQGAISKMSGSFCFVARATPDCTSVRVRPFSFAEMKVQLVCVRSRPYIFAVHLH